VPGLVAVVLGGSRATGTHTPASDVDLGLYYHADQLDLAALRQVAMDLDDRHEGATLTAPGGWGAWVDGGGWLTIGGQAVDFLYREIDRVAGVVADAVVGRFQVAYHWGHPHGFISTIYAAEVAACRVLWERDGAITILKARLEPYPPALQVSFIEQFAAEAEFFVMVARHGLPRRDVAYTAGCAYRIVACLMQVICAANGRWVLNEKGAVAIAAMLPRTLPDLPERVAAIFAFAASVATLPRAVDEVADLVAVIRQIAPIRP
jgi:hypothetical protein